MKCPNCDFETVDGSKFCVDCGSNLVTQTFSRETAPPAPAPVPAPNAPKEGETNVERIDRLRQPFFGAD